MAEKENEYKKLKDKTYKYYSGIGSIFCPYLKSKVRFNSHAQPYKNLKNERIKKLSILGLLPLLIIGKLKRLLKKLETALFVSGV